MKLTARAVVGQMKEQSMSYSRPVPLQSFLDAVRLSYTQRAMDTQTQACLERVFYALETPLATSEREPARLSTSTFLDAALQPAIDAGGDLAALAGRIRDIEGMLAWRRRGGAAPQASASYAEGHANAMIVGPTGLEDRHDVWVGLSLLAPDVRYPDHNHAPEEIYLVLTEGQFCHGDSGWFTPGVGGTLYNRPNVEHAMRSEADRPLLAVWCLFNPAGRAH